MIQDSQSILPKQKDSNKVDQYYLSKRFNGNR